MARCLDINELQVIVEYENDQHGFFSGIIEYAFNASQRAALSC